MSNRPTRTAAAFVLTTATVLSPLPADAAEKKTAAQPQPAIELGAPFADNAILQRQMPVPVWGWSDAGTKVTVEFAGQKTSATAGKDGKWMLKLDALTANATPQKMIITDNGRRMGAKPRGGYITREFAEEFNKGEVTIAATTFLRYGNRAIVQIPPVPQGIFSIWLEEMKLPPLGRAEILRSATVTPMLSTQWQQTLSDEDKFLYDGNFVANAQVLGRWEVIHAVDKIEGSAADPKT